MPNDALAEADVHAEVKRLEALRLRWAEMCGQAEHLKDRMRARAQEAGVMLDARFDAFFENLLQFGGAVDGADDLERRLDGASRSLAGFVMEQFVSPAGDADPLANKKKADAAIGLSSEIAAFPHFRGPASAMLLHIASTRPQLKTQARNALMPHDPQAVVAAYQADEQATVAVKQVEVTGKVQLIAEDPNWKLMGGMPRD